MNGWPRVRTPRPARLALVLSLLLVLPACQQSVSEKPKGGPSNTDGHDHTHDPSKLPEESGYAIDMIDRKITIKMKGDDNADFTGTNKLRIQSPGNEAPLNIMAIGTDGYIDVGGNVKLSIGIVLTNLYKADGKYTLAPNAAPSPGSTPSRVTFYADNASTPERTVRAYDTLTKPCPILIRNRGKAGEVHCPEITSVEKTTVSFDMVWGE